MKKFVLILLIIATVGSVTAQVKKTYQELYECEMEADINTSWPETALIHTKENGGKFWVIINGVATEVTDAPFVTSAYKSQWNTAYTHSQATHAPANAQKNSDITKAEIEAVLTGEISSHSHAGGGSAITGEIKMWPTATPPSGYLICDGSAVSRATYSALYTVIGDTFGAGDGSTTFNLPNFKGRAPVGVDAAQTEFDVMAESGGAKTHTLTAAEMPAHTHSQNTNSSASGGTGKYALDTNASGTQDSGGVITGSTGGGAAHNNLQPYIVINFIIKT